MDEKRRRKESDVVVIMVGRRKEIWLSRKGIRAGKV